MKLSKRDLLLALTAIGAGAAFPARAQQGEVDLAAGRAIGEAYRGAYPGDDLTRANLLPAGADAASLARLRAQVAEDFRAGRVFIYEGWRLSRTEGRLFALLAAA